MIAAAAVSDLFFNHEHPRYDALLAEHNRKKQPTSPEYDDVEAALRQDAAEFATLVNDAFGIELDAEALAADCHRRI